MAASIRADLYLGTACGLALAALVWGLVLGPPPFAAETLLVLAIATAIGASGPRSRSVALPTTYPVALAVLALLSPGASCLGVALCATAGLRGRRGVSRATLRVSRDVLAAAVSAPVYLALGGAVGAVEASPEVLAPVAAHLVVFGGIRWGLSHGWLAVLGRRPRRVAWMIKAFAEIPAYAAGAALGHGAAWAMGRPQSRLLLVTLVLVWLAVALRRGRVERQRLLTRQRANLASLHHSVTRALAKTVEARDADTRDHLRRVRRLCLEVGKRLGVSGSQLQALASAALLHDIGKVALPDGILTKPGRLSETEMHEVRSHPVIGADILQGVPTPAPLAPIVRSHHERWDGQGYPDGLDGEAIPLGARILSVVDSYDALTSDRPYRKALSHRDAVTYLESEAGRMFDPRIVRALIELVEETEPGLAEPARGAVEPPRPDTTEERRAGGIPQAQQELQTLYDIARAMGYGLTLEEYLTLVCCQVATLVPYVTCVVYLTDPEQRLLRATFAMGKAAVKLRLMTIPLGERLSGWAAENQQAVIARDHAVPVDRDGSRSDLEEWVEDEEIRELKTTLAVPLIFDGRALGVFTLYDAPDREFTADDRRILVRVSGYVAEVAAREEGRSSRSRSTLTDPLTGVPNARFLWLESAHRIAQPAEPDGGFGMLAFRIHGLETVGERLGNDAADRVLCQIARRFAASCRRSETLVRFGHELFVVLTPLHRSGELVERWHALAEDVEHPALESREGVVHQIRLTAAHASYPEDGVNLDALLEALDVRLSLAATRGKTIVPFRSQRPASHRTDGQG